jgi:RNA polymerase sigma-70 factor (ECF subfamily)
MTIVHSEREMIDGCLAGSRPMQQYVYQRYYSSFLKICLRYSNNYADAKHLLNDGFLRIFTKTATYSGAGSFEGWMRKTIVNICLDHVRERTRNRKVMASMENEKLEQVSGADDPAAIHKMGFDELLRVIHALPELPRTVFNLHVFEEYSHKEIAALLGMKEGTSYWYLNKAKAAIKEKLGSLRT